MIWFLALYIFSLAVFPNKLWVNLTVLAAVYMFFVTGYHVFAVDQIQYFLLPFREIYPNFSLKDWFVWDTSHYHYFFSWFVKGLYFLTRENLQPAIFVSWFFFLLGFLHALYLICRATGGTYASFMGAVLFLGLYAYRFIAWRFAYHDILIADQMGLVVTMYSAAFLLERKIIAAFSTLGLASVVHVNYGIVGLPVFLAYVLWDWKEIRVQSLMIALAIFSALAMIVFLPTLKDFQGVDSAEGLRLVTDFRTPHVYKLGWSTRREWHVTLAPVILALLFLFRQRQGTPLRRLILILVVFMGIFYVILQNNGPLIFERVYVWRLVPLLMLLAYAAISNEIVAARGFRWGAVVILSLYLFVWFIGQNGWGEGFLIAGIFLAAVGSLKLFKWANTLAGATVIGSLAIVIASGVGHAFVPQQKKIQIYYQNTLYSWVRTNTPPDALFMAPPLVQGFQINSHRSIIVCYKTAPNGRGFEMLEWKKRLEDISSVPANFQSTKNAWPYAYELQHYYLAASPDQVKSIMKKFNANYFLTTRSHQALDTFEKKGFLLCFQDDHSVVFKLAPAK